MHPHNAAEALPLAGALVDHLVTLFHRALINAHEGELAVRIVDQLERHAHERLGRIGGQREFFFGIVPLLGLNFVGQRRRQVAHDRIQQRLHAFVLVGRAHEHRRGVLILHGVFHRGVDQFFRHFLLGQQHFHQLVAVHRQTFQHRVALLLGFFQHVGGNGFAAHVFAVVAVEVHGLHRDQVDDACEFVFLADGKLHQNGVAFQLLAHLLHHPLRIGAGAVHLVDERQSRHMVALHLAIDGHRLTLYATHRAEHEDGAVQHAQAAFHLDGEIDVARRIDEIDLVVGPLCRRPNARWWRRW